MKKLTYYLLFFIIISCNKDDNNTTIDDQEENIEISELEISATEPCLYSDFDIQENSTIVINCLLDLEGQTIDVPPGVTFIFDGGDIFNGTLNFSSAGQIDGELLNSRLTIEGNVQLTDSEFIFYPERWEIIQTDSNATPPIEVDAFNNHLILQNTIDLVYQLGATTVTLSEMDAYFHSDHIVTAVLSLPSNFTLQMSSNTVLRVFPTDNTFSSKMIKIDDQDNVTISGGKIIGDRLLHGPTQGNNTLVDIVGARNIIVENMDLSLGFTGLTVYGHSWFDFPDQATRPYIPSEDVIIRNNTFESNQSNNLSVTDGYRILIEDNRLYNAGNDLENTYGTSTGLAPRIGIVIEPAFDGPGFTQRIEDVEILNNTVDGTQTNAILALGAYRVTIDGNTSDGTIGWTSARTVTVTNNTINGAGINGGFTTSEPSTGNVIANNTINNAGTGIYLTNENIEVYDNTITNSTIGIMMASLLNTEVYDNIITNTTDENAWGINAQFYVGGVDVYDNTVTINNGLPMFFIGINRDDAYADYEVNVHHNYFNADSNLRVANTNGIHFDTNEFEDTGITFGGSSNCSLTNNIINSKTNTALNINRADGSVQNILIENNTIANTSSNRLNAYGVRINTVGSDYITEDSNIDIIGNTISSVGDNYGFHSTNFDDITIDNNIIENESIYFHPLYFIGNNSTITDNTMINDDKEFLIEGNNNIVSGNTQ